jgi:hypothetical protein
MRILFLAALLGALAACSPGDTRKIDAHEAAPSPTSAASETFKSCTWGEVRGAGLSIWSYACGPEYGNVRLVGDDALPGFVLESTAPDGVTRTPVIRVFGKDAEAPIEAVLPAVREASPGPDTVSCAFTPATSADNAGRARFNFTPTGPAAAAWAASVASDVPGEPPCGDLGVSIVGDRYFEVLEGAPRSVVFVEQGSEIQIFDSTTLKPLASSADAPH